MPISRLFAIAISVAILCSCGSNGESPETTVSSAPGVCGVTAGVPEGAMPSSQSTGLRQALAVSAAGGLPAGSTIRVLWVGNSLTGTPPDYNDYSLGPMPARLVPMLAELGITMIYTDSIKGGAAFADHVAYAPTTTALDTGTYDIVNFQGNPYDVAYTSAANFQAAVYPLYAKAHVRGKQVLFQQLWTFRDNVGNSGEGNIQFPAAALALEEAAQNMPGANAVQVQRVWQAIRSTNAGLYRRFYTDGIHQSMISEYLNALVFARFFSGRSIQSIASIPALVDSALTPSEKQSIKDAVNANVTIFYGASNSATPITTLSLSTPTDRQVFAAGSTVNFAATAQDTMAGTLDSTIEWRDANNALMFKGASFSRGLSPGVYSVTASATGSTIASITRQFTVDDGVNDPPVAVNKAANSLTCEPFRQINLTSSASDTDSTINWATLQLDKSQFKGTSAVASTVDPSTVNLSYMNGYVGLDTLRWRVQDSAGAWSNWANITVTVASR
jgi:hypothetical protein